MNSITFTEIAAGNQKVEVQKENERQKRAQGASETSSETIDSPQLEDTSSNAEHQGSKRQDTCL